MCLTVSFFHSLCRCMLIAHAWSDDDAGGC